MCSGGKNRKQKKTQQKTKQNKTKSRKKKTSPSLNPIHSYRTPTMTNSRNTLSVRFKTISKAESGSLRLMVVVLAMGQVVIVNEMVPF
jgi:hypothetical protein